MTGERPGRAARIAGIAVGATLCLGAHCGEPFQLVRARQSGWAEVSTPVRVRLTRPDKDFRTAKISVEPRGVRFARCDGTPLPPSGPSWVVVVTEPCVDAFIDTLPAPASPDVQPAQKGTVSIEIETDIGREVLLQRNYSPHDARDPEGLVESQWLNAQSRPLGIDEKPWHTWAMKVEPR